MINGLILITDTHLSETNHRTIYNLFSQVIDKCKEHQVDTIIHLGDVFDSRKGQPVSTLITFLEILNSLQKHEIKMICLVGNHDKLDQALTGSFLEPFTNHPSLDLINSHDIRHVDGQISLGLVSYFKPEVQANLVKELEEKLGPKVKNSILLTHADIVSFKMAGSKLSTTGLETLALKSWKQVLSGHYHDASSSGNISYIGASLQHNYGEAKVKGCHLLSFIKTKANVEVNLDLIMLDFPRFESIYVKSYLDLPFILEEPREQKSRICIELTAEELSLSFYELTRLENLGYELSINKTDLIHNPSEDLKRLEVEVSLVDLLDIYCQEKQHENFNELKKYFNV